MSPATQAQVDLTEEKRKDATWLEPVHALHDAYEKYTFYKRKADEYFEKYTSAKAEVAFLNLVTRTPDAQMEKKEEK